MLTDEEKAYLAEVDARERAATPGPWGWSHHYDAIVDGTGEILFTGKYLAANRFERDRSFIAHARTDIPRLLEIIKRLEKDNEHNDWCATNDERSPCNCDRRYRC